MTKVNHPSETLKQIKATVDQIRALKRLNSNEILAKYYPDGQETIDRWNEIRFKVYDVTRAKEEELDSHRPDMTEADGLPPGYIMLCAQRDDAKALKDEWETVTDAIRLVYREPAYLEIQGSTPMLPEAAKQAFELAWPKRDAASEDFRRLEDLIKPKEREGSKVRVARQKFWDNWRYQRADVIAKARHVAMTAYDGYAAEKAAVAAEHHADFLCQAEINKLAQVLTRQLRQYIEESK